MTAYSQNCADTISSQDKRNILSLAIDYSKCDSVGKEKDRAIEGFKSTIVLDSILLANKVAQFTLLSDNASFKQDQIEGLTNRLSRSDNQKKCLKIGCITALLGWAVDRVYSMFH